MGASSVPTAPHGGILIDAAGATRPIDRRLFGTNVPAWLGAATLQADWFHRALADAGVTVVRMPGGSWSNTYPWEACERERPECWAAGSAKPSDFAALLGATGIEGMWTVSVNETAQSAAALVAFFNGATDDTRPIGVDRHGTDWGTVATWAQLRADGGNAEPVPIARWEIGNEVWGGRPDAGGAECAEFGWEDVWTCDGAAYMTGDGDHDGYLAFREAMRAVDPTIEVGAVGVASPGDWSDWGAEVLAHAEAVDFYVVHEYGFDTSPAAADAVARPAERWPEVAAGAAPDLGPAQIAITEYNLVSFEAGDTELSMTTAANAFFLADSLGRFAVAGIGAANHWNFANGTTGSGSDYGLVALETQDRWPAFAAFAAWSSTGSELLTEVPTDPAEGVSLYATRHTDGALAVIVLNAGEARTLDVSVTGAGAAPATLASYTFENIDATTATREPDVDLGSADALASIPLPARSINVVQVASPRG